VIRALVGWGIASFAVLQVIEPVLHAYHLPEWPLTLVVTALGAGFPITAILAWIFDLTTKGVERTHPIIGREVGKSGLAGPRLVAVLLALGLLAAAPGLIYFFVRPGAALSAPGTVSVKASPATSPSIAVLPFVDMSPGGDQQHLSDGIAEEILDGLSHLEGLHVAGRTSSFSFKGKNEDLRTIAQKLGVGALLEGSVRKERGRLKVTAQLVNAADGFRLWSQTFDRELTGVFAVEEEIGRAVVEALRVKLVAGRGPSSGDRHTAQSDAYEQVLLGDHLTSRGTRPDADSVKEDRQKAIKAYQAAIAIDPNYAPAWAGLAIAHTFAGMSRSLAAPTLAEHFVFMEQASEEADRAVALGPDLAIAYRARGFVRCSYKWDWAGCRADLERDLALNPGSAKTLAAYVYGSGGFGRLDDTVRIARRSAELDPLSFRACSKLAHLLVDQGALDEARATQRRCAEIKPDHTFTLTALVALELAAHRPAAALEAAKQISDESLRLTALAMAHHDLGDWTASNQALGGLMACCSAISALRVAEVYAHRGDRDRAFEWLDRAVAQRDTGILGVRWDPDLRGLHGDPRWAALLKKLNLPLD
jgi:TolB-like protein/tetratricopeptide (TPR) repeat protein